LIAWLSSARGGGGQREGLEFLEAELEKKKKKENQRMSPTKISSVRLSRFSDSFDTPPTRLGDLALCRLPIW